MKILFLTVDDITRASSRTRVYQYLPHLDEAGIKYDVIPWNGKTKYPIFKNENTALKKFINFLSSEIINYFVMTAKITWALLNIKKYDLVFVQKITLRRLLYWLKATRAKVIYDIDDAIYTAHSKDLAAQGGNIRISQTIEYMKFSRYIIVELPSTEAVARENCKNVSSILGPIDLNRYKPTEKKAKDKITIGWIGSHGNTFYLFMIKDILEKLCRKYPNVEIKLVGTRGFETKEPKIIKREWSLDTELNELESFDIGIMPLTDDEWSRGKGSYKLLQYMALGIPAVSSPVGINRELIADGVNGFHAVSNEDWEVALSKLIEDRELRESMGKAGRERVKAYSLEDAAPKFIEILKSVGIK